MRDVLGELEAKGYVSRRRGAGTTINKHILEQRARLDIDYFYEDMIRRSGYQPSCSVKKLALIQDTTPNMRNWLGLKENEQLHLIKKVLSADGKPVMRVDDYIPERYYDKDNIDIPLIEKSTFFFVIKYCDEWLDTSISRVDTCLADEELAEDMQVEVGFPLLMLESVVYSIKQRPLVYSLEYINTRVMPFSIQKRLTRHNFSEYESTNL